MLPPALLRLAAALLLALAGNTVFGAETVPEQRTKTSTNRDLDHALASIAPEIKKWAVVCIARPAPDGRHAFEWIDFNGTASRTDFWPASTIKLYAVIAAVELLNENGFDLDTTVQFEHRDGDTWTLDCARTMREMISEVFRRSSNEDYTLLLRMVGIDRINTQFLIPERGFPTSALMRGYVIERPFRYVLKEPQRITLRSADGKQSAALEHTWSGYSYSQERGGTVIDAKTGNVTSPRELLECLRRVLFHDELASDARYRISSEQAAFIREGGAGLVGLETRLPDSVPSAWTGGIDTVFPKARFFHKNGTISNYAMDLAYVDDSADSGVKFLLLPIVNAGESSNPQGHTYVAEMAGAIARWVRGE